MTSREAKIIQMLISLYDGRLKSLGRYTNIQITTKNNKCYKINGKNTTLDGTEEEFKKLTAHRNCRYKNIAQYRVKLTDIIRYIENEIDVRFNYQDINAARLVSYLRSLRIHGEYILSVSDDNEKKQKNWPISKYMVRLVMTKWVINIILAMKKLKILHKLLNPHFCGFGGVGGRRYPVIDTLSMLIIPYIIFSVILARCKYIDRRSIDHQTIAERVYDVIGLYDSLMPVDENDNTFNGPILSPTEQNTDYPRQRHHKHPPSQRFEQQGRHSVPSANHKRYRHQNNHRQSPVAAPISSASSSSSRQIDDHPRNDLHLPNRQQSPVPPPYISKRHDYHRNDQHLSNRQQSTVPLPHTSNGYDYHRNNLRSLNRQPSQAPSPYTSHRYDPSLPHRYPSSASPRPFHPRPSRPSHTSRHYRGSAPRLLSKHRSSKSPPPQTSEQCQKYDMNSSDRYQSFASSMSPTPPQSFDRHRKHDQHLLSDNRQMSRSYKTQTNRMRNQQAYKENIVSDIGYTHRHRSMLNDTDNQTDEPDDPNKRHDCFKDQNESHTSYTDDVYRRYSFSVFRTRCKTIDEFKMLIGDIVMKWCRITGENFTPYMMECFKTDPYDFGDVMKDLTRDNFYQDDVYRFVDEYDGWLNEYSEFMSYLEKCGGCSMVKNE